MAMQRGLRNWFREFFEIKDEASVSQESFGPGRGESGQSWVPAFGHLRPFARAAERAFKCPVLSA